MTDFSGINWFTLGVAHKSILSSKTSIGRFQNTPTPLSPKFPNENRCNFSGQEKISYRSLRRVMRAIARARIGTRMEPIMRAIHRTHESDVLQLFLAFIEFSIC